MCNAIVKLRDFPLKFPKIFFLTGETHGKQKLFELGLNRHIAYIIDCYLMFLKTTNIFNSNNYDKT